MVFRCILFIMYVPFICQFNNLQSYSAKIDNAYLIQILKDFPLSNDIKFTQLLMKYLRQAGQEMGSNKGGPNYSAWGWVWGSIVLSPGYQGLAMTVRERNNNQSFKFIYACLYSTKH